MFKRIQARLPFLACSAGLYGLVLIVACAGGPAHAQCRNEAGQYALNGSDPRYAALQRALDAYTADYQRKDKFSGVSLHVSLSADGPTLNVASGKTSFENGRAICPDTLFQIGSITKSYTSVLLLQLEAEGKLSIHDTLGEWLPQYPAWSTITIEQLLNMTAPTSDEVWSTAYQKAVATNIHRTFGLEQLVGYAYPGPPGPKPAWRYVNTNYTLAAMIIEEASGMSYSDALAKRLLQPLRLHETYYQPRVPPPRILDAMASGYAEQSLCKSIAKVMPPCPEWPIDGLLGHDMKTANRSMDDGSGGIVASLPDVTRWVRALFGDTLLPPREKAELFSLVSQASGRPIAATSPADPRGYSLGLAQNWLPLTRNPLWAYQGETFGYEVLWARRAGDDVVVVLAQNSATADNNLAALYETVLRILEPQSLVHPATTPLQVNPTAPTSR